MQNQVRLSVLNSLLRPPKKRLSQHVIEEILYNIWGLLLVSRTVVAIHQSLYDVLGHDVVDHIHLCRVSLVQSHFQGFQERLLGVLKRTSYQDSYGLWNYSSHPEHFRFEPGNFLMKRSSLQEYFCQYVGILHIAQGFVYSNKDLEILY